MVLAPLASDIVADPASAHRVLRITDRGLYCRGRRPLHRSLAPRRPRGDHARARRSRALGKPSLPRARARARACCARGSAPQASIEPLDYGETRRHQRRPRLAAPGGAHPRLGAGSASSIAAKSGSSSGDYKTEPDPTCTPFEPVRCHTFITESTFGLPIYRWSPEPSRSPTIRAWWRDNADAGPRVACCSATRSARRSGCSPDSPARTSGPIYTHGAVERLNRDYRAAGVRLADTRVRERMPKGHDLRRQPDRRAAVGGGEHVAAAIRRRLDRLRVGLDAGARRAPASRARPRLRAVRSRRLAGAARGDRGDGRRARVGDARHARAARALAHRARHRRARVASQWKGEDDSRPGRGRRRGDRRREAFARLFAAIDETTRTNEKVDAMAEYFATADPADAAWAVYFLCGGRPKRLIPVRRLAAWAMEEADVPEWLFEECYDAVGDLAETMSLLLPDARDAGATCRCIAGSRSACSRSRRQSEEEQRATIVAAWRELAGTERLHLEQADHGRLSCRRVAAARRACARRGEWRRRRRRSRIG